MTDTQDQANPYTPEPSGSPAADSESVSSSDQQPPPVVLRLWPAIIIVALMWFLIVVPGKLFPLTFIHFMSMQFGPILSALALAIWWLASRGIPWRQRWVGLLFLGVTVIAAMFLVNSSLTITMLVYGIPTAMTLLIAAFALFRRRPWNQRRWIGYVSFLSIFIAALFVRIGQIDAAFSFTLVPRWAPTAEDEFLANLEGSGESVSPMDAQPVLPEEASEKDWAEFRGPRRDGCVRSVSFATDWDANPPRELWRRSVGPGWSSFCVVGPLAFTQEQRGENESVVAYRVSDGSQVWAQSIAARFEASMGGVGPRATPTFSAGRLFVTGGTGIVQCLNASTGQTIWSYDLVEELEIKTPAWGFSSSPLVTGELVIVFASGGEGKGVVALDRESGTLQWSGSDGYHAYSSPQLSTIDGQQHIVISSNLGLCGLSLEDGSILWQHDWDIGQMARVTQPLVVENAVYLGTGYGNGTERVNVHHSPEGWKVDGTWIAPLKPYFNDFVHHDGHLYGFDNAIFVSIDAQTGERNWKGGRYGNGQVLLVDEMGMLLVISEKGELLLVKATPDEHLEVASLEALDGVTWNHPVIAGGKLFLRNSQEAVCYELPDLQSGSKSGDQ